MSGFHSFINRVRTIVTVWSISLSKLFSHKREYVNLYSWVHWPAFINSNHYQRPLCSFVQQETQVVMFWSVSYLRTWWWSIFPGCDRSSDRSLLLDPLSYFSIQPVHHNWSNKGRGMCYPVWVMLIQGYLLLVGKSSPRNDGSRLSLPLSKWFLTICRTLPPNR